MIHFSNLILLSVAKDGRYLRLHRRRTDFLEILKYRECTSLIVEYQGTEVTIIDSLHTYNEESLGSMESPGLSIMLEKAGFKPKDNLIAELKMDYGIHHYCIIGKVLLNQ